MAMVKVNPPFIHRWISIRSAIQTDFMRFPNAMWAYPGRFNGVALFRSKIPSLQGQAPLLHAEGHDRIATLRQARLPGSKCTSWSPACWGLQIAKNNKQRKPNKCTPMHHLEMVLSLRLANGHLLLPFYQDLYKCLQIFYAPGPNSK
jgi:hypothetical protein